jgi:glutamate 5-kinase
VAQLLQAPFRRAAFGLSRAIMRIAQLSHLADPAHCPRLVIKVGSALLVGKDGQPRRAWLTALVAEIAAARAAGSR